MSTRLRFVMLSLLLAAVFGSSALRGQEKKPDAPAFDSEAMKKMMEEYARVTENHAGFKRLVGKWNTEMTCYMPGSPTAATKGTATFRLLMGGRFMQQNFEGEIEGQKFQGTGITGYDNAQKKYVGIWIDNMGTGIMHMTGSYDEKTHTMTELGESIMPTGPMKMKMVTRPVDDNKFVFTMYTLGPDGGEQKMMEITYTRAADAPKTNAEPKASAVPKPSAVPKANAVPKPDNK
jgi:hypothetical protein